MKDMMSSCISRELRRNCSENQDSYLPDIADQAQTPKTDELNFQKIIGL